MLRQILAEWGLTKTNPSIVNSGCLNINHFVCPDPWVDAVKKSGGSKVQGLILTGFIRENLPYLREIKNCNTLCSLCLLRELCGKWINRFITF